MSATNPLDTDLEWCFTYYVYGCLAGLLIIIFVSGFLFEQRMLFLPIFTLEVLNALFHTVILFICLSTDK